MQIGWMSHDFFSFGSCYTVEGSEGCMLSVDATFRTAPMIVFGSWTGKTEQGYFFWRHEFEFCGDLGILGILGVIRGLFGVLFQAFYQFGGGVLGFLAYLTTFDVPNDFFLLLKPPLGPPVGLARRGSLF